MHDVVIAAGVVAVSVVDAVVVEASGSLRGGRRNNSRTIHTVAMLDQGVVYKWTIRFESEDTEREGGGDTNLSTHFLLTSIFVFTTQQINFSNFLAYLHFYL